MNSNGIVSVHSIKTPNRSGAKRPKRDVLFYSVSQGHVVDYVRLQDGLTAWAVMEGQSERVEVRLVKSRGGYLLVSEAKELQRSVARSNRARRPWSAIKDSVAAAERLLHRAYA